LPSAQERVREAAHGAHELTALSDWQFVQIADRETVPQVHRPVLKLGAIRVLDESSHVSVRISQVLGEGVGGQEIEAVCEPLVQWGLERVIEHLQLRIVER